MAPVDTPLFLRPAQVVAEMVMLYDDPQLRENPSALEQALSDLAHDHGLCALSPGEYEDDDVGGVFGAPSPQPSMPPDAYEYEGGEEWEDEADPAAPLWAVRVIDVGVAPGNVTPADVCWARLAEAGCAVRVPAMGDFDTSPFGGELHMADEYGESAVRADFFFALEPEARLLTMWQMLPPGPLEDGCRFAADEICSEKDDTMRYMALCGEERHTALRRGACEDEYHVACACVFQE